MFIYHFSQNGLTPLHVAVHYNQMAVVIKLLKYGASLETQTKVIICLILCLGDILHN